MPSHPALAFAGMALALTAAAAPQAGEPPLLGFLGNHAAAERALEARFDATLVRDDLRQWMQRLSAHPHHLGSAYGRENALYLAAQFRSWGYETEIEEFAVLFPTPTRRLLEMTAPEPFRAALAEPVLGADSTTGQAGEQLPVYNVYSVDGDVTGDLVYVNYGVPKDYEELDWRGIDVRGKIVIARYGGSWRGIKPKVAAEHGATGCIIYSDPRDDGYFQGDDYPRGAYRPDRGAQRGSVADMPLYPGDPLTPGVGATKGAKRLAVQEAPTLTKIPVLPVAYADALPLLRALGGPVAPEKWRGALPITYHLGPGPAQVHLAVACDWQTVTAYDVVARMAGSERPDEWIIRGNHHDAWVNGADDPVSGLVALLAEARGVGALVKNGWRPRRTIVYAAWDGEEPGLLGSTEWAEAHADLLRSKAVVYINSDSNGRGFLSAGGSHTLERFVNQVAEDVIDPEKGTSVAARARAYRLLDASPEDRQELRQRKDLRLSALGSGSDYTVFLDHLGISALNLGYGGEDGGGSYHSIYDSFAHYTRFGDPKFDYGIAMAETAGRAVLRLAAADFLPFEFTDFADTIAKYAKEVAKLADDMRAETEETNRRIQDRTYEAVADPTATWVTPKVQPAVPYLELAPLQNAVARLQASAGDYDRAMVDLAAGGAALPGDAARALDEVLMRAERALTRGEGLPRRPWFRHQVYAPGFYTGYGAKTLPGVREAVEQRHWQEAGEQVPVVARALEAFAGEIDGATSIVRRAIGGSPVQPRGVVK